MLLVGDIGGTRSRLAILPPGADPTAMVAEASFASRDYAGLQEMVRRFLGQTGIKVDRAVLAVAGPVLNGTALLTNLSWRVSGEELRTELGLDSVQLINDLVAMAEAVPHLSTNALRTLQQGSPTTGAPLAIVAPGTGLGEAFLIHDGRHYAPQASEGGHADFAPVDALQLELLRWLLPRLPHVSYESVCSGRGLPLLYRFLEGRAAEPEAPAWAGRIAQAADATPLLIEAGLSEHEPSALCADTLELFSAILAAEAGNMALRVLATGGVYLGGGLPRRMLPVLTRPEFMERFRRKGRLSSLLARVPVHVVVQSNVALLGAAYYALDDVAEGAAAFDRGGETLARPPRT